MNRHNKVIMHELNLKSIFVGMTRILRRWRIPSDSLPRKPVLVKGQHLRVLITRLNMHSLMH